MLLWWNEFTEELFYDNREEKILIHKSMERLETLKSEVKETIVRIKVIETK